MRPLLALAILALAAPASAASTFQMVHSGRLFDNADHPLTNEAVRLGFKLYNVSAPIETEVQLWSVEYTVPVVNGNYVVTLGSGAGGGIPANLFTPGAFVYLEVSVGGTRLLPRMRIGEVPVAASALTIGGHPLEDFVLKADLPDAAYSKAEVDAKLAELTSNSTTGLSSKASAADLAALGDSVADDLALKANAANVYSKAEADAKLVLKANAADVYTKAETDAALAPKANAADVLKLTGGALSGDLTTTGKVGIGSAAPVAALDVAGGVRIGNDQGTCDANRTGTLRYGPGGLSVCAGAAGWTTAANSVVALTDGATVNVDATAGNVFTLTLGGNRTIANPTGLVNGGTYTFRFMQDGTGSRQITWGSKYFFSGTNTQAGATPNGLTIFTFVSDGTNLYATGGYNLTPNITASYYQCAGQVNYVAFVKNSQNLSISSIAEYVNACKAYGFKAIGSSHGSITVDNSYTLGTDYLKAVGCHNCYWPDGGNAWYYSYADANGGGIGGTTTTCQFVAGADATAGGQKVAGIVVNANASNLNCGTFRGPLGLGSTFGDNNSNYASHPLVFADTNSNGSDTCNRRNVSSRAVVYTGTPAYLLCASATIK